MRGEMGMEALRSVKGMVRVREEDGEGRDVMCRLGDSNILILTSFQPRRFLDRGAKCSNSL